MNEKKHQLNHELSHSLLIFNPTAMANVVVVVIIIVLIAATAPEH